MTAGELAERLHGRRSGRGWVARCPAHADRNPSLSIGEGGDGRVLLKCWAGCSVPAVLDAAGLRWRDIMPHGDRVPAPTDGLSRKTKGSIAAAQESLRRHPGGSFFREESLRVVICDTQSVDAAIVRALGLAVEGELVQLARENEELNAA